MDRGQVSCAHQVQEPEVLGLIPPTLWGHIGRRVILGEKRSFSSLLGTQKNLLKAGIYPTLIC